VIGAQGAGTERTIAIGDARADRVYNSTQSRTHKSGQQRSQSERPRELHADHPEEAAQCVVIVSVLDLDLGSVERGYSNASEALTAVTDRSSQRSRVVRSVHASMRTSSSLLSVNCRRASTRRREARVAAS